MSNFSDVLDYELGLIKLDNYREMTKYLLDNRVPHYFFDESVLSSSSKKYHPLNKDGNHESLMQHTKSVVRTVALMIANPLTDYDYNFNDEDKSMLISAAILHDSVKYGYPDKSENTVFEHPLLVSALADRHIGVNYSQEFINVADLISAHHGPWQYSDYSEVILPSPYNMKQRILHYADYFSSRVFVRVDYEDESITRL